MRVLLVRTDRIGDLILTTPAIATVRASFPNARVTMICNAYNRVVIERNTDIDDIIEIGAHESTKAIGARVSGADIAIALSPRIIDMRIAGASRAPVRVGYTYVRRWTARLAGRLYVNRMMISEADPDLCDRDPHRHVRHEVNQLLDLVALAGATERRESLRLDVTQADRDGVAFVPQGAIVMHLGLRWFSDGSTLESTVQLVRELRGVGLPLVLTYAPEAERYMGAFAQARVADVVLGGLPFHAWVAVFERASIIVTVDTGATHVASAVRRPTVVAYEHRHFRLSSQEWAPYGVPSVLVRKPAGESPGELEQFRRRIVDAVTQFVHA